MRKRNMGLESLPPPPKGFDPACKADLQPAADGILELQRAVEEDRKRSSYLFGMDSIDAWGEYPDQSAIALEIEQGLDDMLENDEPFRSLASAAYVNSNQRNLSGQLWKLGHSVGYEDRTFTLLPNSWEIPAWKLPYVDASKKVDALYHLLREYGGKDASGYLVAGLHGEYYEPEGTYHLHMHGVAFGEMIDVVDNLRKARDFIRLEEPTDTKKKPSTRPNPV